MADVDAYIGEITKLMKIRLSPSQDHGVYLTFNKPAHSLAPLFECVDHKSTILFLDAVSNHMGLAADSKIENAFFISNPQDLTQLTIALNRVLKMHEFALIFVDSMPSMLQYNDNQTSGHFLHAISAICQQNGVDLVIMANPSLPEAVKASIMALSPQEIKTGALETVAQQQESQSKLF